MLPNVLLGVALWQHPVSYYQQWPLEGDSEVDFPLFTCSVFALAMVLHPGVGGWFRPLISFPEFFH